MLLHAAAIRWAEVGGKRYTRIDIIAAITVRSLLQVKMNPFSVILFFIIFTVEQTVAT
jgi:hypothetical protein